MASLGKQFILLLWKNWVLQKRKVCVTVFEILLPLLFALILVIIRAVSDSTYVDKNTIFESFKPASFVTLPGTTTKNVSKSKICYYPNETNVLTLLENLNTSVYSLTNEALIFEGFNSESDLVDRYYSDEQVWAGVVFSGDYSSGIPAQVTYSLRVAYRTGEDRDRWRTAQTYPFFTTLGPRSKNTINGGQPYYNDTGFLWLKYMIDKAIIEDKASGLTDLETKANLELKKMPFIPYLDDVLTTVLQTQLPLFIILSFILNALQIAKNISYEKEKKLKESMKMMGLSTFIYWLSWFVKALIYLAIAMALYTILLKVPIGEKGKVLNYTDGSLFYFFLFCYALATIAFCFMISTFFSKSNSAAFAAGILFFLTYFPYFFLTDRYEDMSQGEKMAACLLSNIGMALGVNTISIYEGTGEGAQWNNFYSPGTVDDNFSLLDACAMLLVDTVLYMVIAWYVDNINPGESGVAQPPWFPFMPSYWCGRKASEKDYETVGNGTIPSDYFERDPGGLKVGISIRHLRKLFDKKVAVDNTTLNMFEGQITSLLGHNGAGKTTTMSMLTGFLAPTSGTALVNGYDIRTEISQVRKSLGLCPQHNILFDLMTVEEHLTFFAQLKGCDSKDVKSEVNRMIDVLGLQSKRNAMSATLSGGQKRKLSVGIALIADSKIVILDEPTSGMDPAARRQTWEILQKYREGRTIILTTHFMDEADILGDRIAIMAEGVVKCCGTSMFLKKLYGAGYHMVIVKNRSCSVDKVTSLVRSHIESAMLESEISAEVSYLLPFDQSEKFERLFLEVESRMSELGITSFGTSATTMEEVFLKVGEGAADDENDEPLAVNSKSGFTNPSYGSLANGIEKPKIAFENSQGVANGNLPEKNPDGGLGSNSMLNGGMTKSASGSNVVPLGDVEGGNFISFNLGIEKNAGMTLVLQQFWGMFVKKVIHTWRNRVVTFVQLLLPILFTVLALLIEEIIPTPGDEPSLKLDLSAFSQTNIAYSDGTGTPSADATNMADAYKNQFSAPNLVKIDRSQYSTMDDYFLERADDAGISTLNRRYIVAGDFQTDGSLVNTTAHFNGQPYHGVALSLHYMMNGLYQHFTDDTHSISTFNYPFPKRIKDNTRRLFFATQGTGFTIAISILFGMAFMVTSFIIFLIKERSSGAKHLQVVSGVGMFPFWISNFLWDIVNYTIPVLGMIVVFAAFQTEAYYADGRLGLVLLLFLVYGWAVLPFVYLFHYLFKAPATGMVTVVMINILTGLVFLLATYTLKIPQLGTVEIGEALEWLFVVFFPNYDLGQSILDMYTNNGYKETCEGYNYKMLCSIPNVTNACCFPDQCGGNTCFTFYDDYLNWGSPGIGRYLVFMAFQGFLYFGIVFLIESKVIDKVRYHFSNQKSPTVGSSFNIREGVMPSQDTEDSDVADERKRLNETSMTQLMDTDSLILKNVTKYYGNLRAVNQICVGIPAHECFGLLGQNGAGKTTTFKMMTGDEMLTSGQAYLNAYSIKADIKKVQQNLGYCPQFDALIDQMTGRETLTMYARLRGVREDKIKGVVNDLIDIMMLRKHADKQSGLYSGGNKRKLSTAIALIGDPPFIFLDEPTTGMDPGARRQLWNVLSQVRASGRTLVLTSHSMEECDALCTRIVIMVNGRFVCLGSPQHLKNKFGHGYTLTCRMGLDNQGYVASVQPLIEFVKSTYPSTQVFDDQQGYVNFQIPDQSVRLAQIFGQMEEAKKTLNMEDYSVHQTTLEQIFLTFTRNQVPPIEEKKKSCQGLLCCCK